MSGDKLLAAAPCVDADTVWLVISGRAAPSAVTAAVATNGGVDGALADADGIEPTLAFCSVKILVSLTSYR